MLPASAHKHVQLRAPRRLIDVQTAALGNLVIDFLGLVAVLAFAAGMGAAGPLIRSAFGG